MACGSIFSKVSSTSVGSPKCGGVAAARTNIHRGVMTAMPKELSLGFTSRISKPAPPVTATALLTAIALHFRSMQLHRGAFPSVLIRAEQSRAEQSRAEQSRDAHQC